MQSRPANWLAQILVQNRIQHANYDQLVSRLLKGEPLPDLGYVDK